MQPTVKQLHGVCLKVVLEKRRLEQALNCKEFAVLAGVSYGVAREWFHLPTFPVFRGVVFWQDFMQWRMQQIGLRPAKAERPAPKLKVNMDNNLPSQAQKILLAA